MKARYTFGVSVLVLSLVGLIACESSVQTAPSPYAITGTLSKTGVANNTAAYVKLVTQGGASNSAALESATAIFNNGTASYTLPSVEPGSYTLWAFIDVDNSSGGSPTPLAAGTDYALASGIAVAASADQVINIVEEDWNLVPSLSVSGTLQRPEGTGGTIYVKLVASGGVYSAAPLFHAYGDPESDSLNYSIENVAAGTYTLYAFIDDNASSLGFPTSALPDNGEWSYTLATLTVNGNVTLDIPATADWVPFGWHQIMGTLTLAGTADGVLGYVKAVPAEHAFDAEAMFFTSSTPFNGGSATYSFWVSGGSYVIYAFIDADGSESTPSATSMPDVGEYAAGTTLPSTILVDQDVIKSFVDSGDWTRYQIGNVTGTFYYHTATTQFLYAKLVTDGDGPGAAALYSTSVQYNGNPNASIVIPDVVYGTYTMYVFIDMDGDASSMSYMPDAGDLMPEVYRYTITHNSNETFQTDNSWMTVANLSGLLSAPAGLAADTLAYVKLVEPEASSSATGLYNTVTTVLPGSGGNYSFTLLPSGTYRLWVFIDVDGNAEEYGYMASSNDYLAGTDVTLNGNDAFQNIAAVAWTLLTD